MKLFSAFLHACRAGALALLLTGCTSADDVSPSLVGSGQGGAAARLAVQGNTLYAIDNQSLRVFDLGTVGTSSPTTPRLVRTTLLGVDIKTIYPVGSFLFVGTQVGVYIFDATDPQQPRQIGRYPNAVSCNPLVVDGRWAYLTMRTGSSCGAGPNQLQVVDLQDLAQPRLVQNYPMSQPYGLGIDSDTLFVCDDGLKVFDTSQSPTLTQLDQFSVEAYNVLPSRGHLLVLGTQGLYQYQYRHRTLQLLSVLPITPQL